LLHNDQILRKNVKLSLSCVHISGEKDHVGAYQIPCTEIVFSLYRTDCTVISLVVSVPVLSVQITLTAHNVSTAESFFTRAFLLARYDAADASAIFTCAGSH
jgi:hypothetical protein